MSNIDFSCFSEISQKFLICVTVHKATNLRILNADTYVVVSLEDNHKRTAICKSSESPYFNEYFVYDLECTLSELLKKSLTFRLMQRKWMCKKDIVIGEVTLNVSTIWDTSGHALYKKWAQMESKTTEQANNAGYIQLDLAVKSMLTVPTPYSNVLAHDDEIDSHLLITNYLNKPPVRARYKVEVYSGYFDLNRDFYIGINFCGYNAKTSLKRKEKHCVWNQNFLFGGQFPSLCQTFEFHVITPDCCCWIPIASAEINFNNMNFDLDNTSSLSAIGPTYVHFYSVHDRDKYVGSLLLQIYCEKSDDKVVQALQPTSFGGILEADYWSLTNFTCNMIIVGLDALYTNNSKLKVTLEWGASSSNTVQLPLASYSKIKWRYSNFQSSSRPYLSLELQLPENRNRFTLHNKLVKFYTQWVHDLNASCYNNANTVNKDDLIKFINKLMKNIEEFLQLHLRHGHQKAKIVWEERYLMFTKKKFEKISTELKSILNKLVSVAEETITNISKKRYCEDIKMLLKLVKSLTKPSVQNEPPKLLINIQIDGKIKMIGRLRAVDFFASETDKLVQGMKCGLRTDTILKMKDCMHSCKNCGCVGGVISFISWIVPTAYMSKYLPHGVESFGEASSILVPERHFSGKIYLHQAKIKDGYEKSGLCNPVLKMMVSYFCICTKLIQNTLSPVWNETHVFNDLRLSGMPALIEQHFSPTILLTLLFKESLWVSNKICGIGSIKPLFRMNARVFPEVSTLATDGHRQSLVKKISEKLPLQKTNEALKENIPGLRWIKVYRDGRITAEILISAEIKEVEFTVDLVREISVEPELPQEIQLTMVKFKVTAVLYGIRNELSYTRVTAGRYKTELHIGELVLSSGLSGKLSGLNYNFFDPITYGYVNLPSDHDFWPNIVIQHIDVFGRNKQKIIGSSTISKPDGFISEAISISKYKIKHDKHNLISIPKNLNEKRVITVTFDDEKTHESFEIKKSRSGKNKYLHYNWWTKFYASMNFKEKGLGTSTKRSLVIYNHELEGQLEFDKFQDWAKTIPLYKGSKKNYELLSKKKNYCLLKMKIKVEKVPSPGMEALTSLTGENDLKEELMYAEIIDVQEEVNLLVRCYIVRALNLVSCDRTNHSDPYICIQMGNQIIKDRMNFVQNEPSPIFGRLYQLNAALPKDHSLKIAVFDRDETLFDDLIGSTEIDIEDRWNSKHFGRCGLSLEYDRKGYNAWRDKLLPSDILECYCKKYNVSLDFTENSVDVGGVTFTSNLTDVSDLKEKLCLKALHNFKDIPGFGFSLVPEHVETRSLYRMDRPGIEQGKLQLWVELHPEESPPPPIDILPKTATEYEIRAIVWNLADVSLQDRNIFGKHMTDIYVMCWVDEYDKAQCTDVHYRSMNGEGKFNWRMIFPIKYSITEDMMVITRKKTFFEKNDTEIKLPPTLKIQIWDNDSFSTDDFLGTLTINLSSCPIPAPTPKKCKLKKNLNTINLFMERRIFGWFPIYSSSYNGDILQSGKIELEIEILPMSEALVSPVGLGRNGPKPLQKPNRPETSFRWYTHPNKSIKHILGPELKKIALFLLVIIFSMSIIGLIILLVMHKTGFV